MQDDLPRCSTCYQPRGSNPDCRECRARLTIAIGRVRLAGHWRDFKAAIHQLFGRN